MPEDFFTVAVIGQPFALGGFLKLFSLSGENEHLLKLKSVYIRMSQKNHSFNSAEARTLEIECIKEAGAALLIKFKNIDSLEEAKKLVGCELLVKRENGAKLNKNEFYIEDLKGLRVVGQDKALLGSICDIVEGGNGSLAEILLLSGEKKFVPFRGEFFGEISVKKQTAELIAAWVLE